MQLEAPPLVKSRIHRTVLNDYICIGLNTVHRECVLECVCVCVSVCGMMRVQVKNTCEECVELILFGAFSPSSYDEDREVLNVSKQFLR